jgi:hypothetical protein
MSFVPYSLRHRIEVSAMSLRGIPRSVRSRRIPMQSRGLSPISQAIACNRHRRGGERARSFFESSRADRISDRRQFAKDQSRKPDHPFQARRPKGFARGWHSCRCRSAGDSCVWARPPYRRRHPATSTQPAVRCKDWIEEAGASCATVDGLCNRRGHGIK